MALRMLSEVVGRPASGTCGPLGPGPEASLLQCRGRVLTAIDLFSGCGGLTRGLRGAGFTVLGAIEADPVAVTTYLHNNPGVVVWAKKIEDVTVAAVKRRLGLRRGELDLVAGCPPCEGFSKMRTL